METEVGEMRGLEKAVEWLRAFVENHGWDYCVVWKLNDDPSRFVEFVDCCCAGGYVSGTVKAEESGDQTMRVCRDAHGEHLICSRACETLAQIPDTMPLYSGIHTDVAMTNQSMWLSEDRATLVLIPLGGGLIELFAAKLVDKDQMMLDFVQYQYNASLECHAIESYLNPSVDNVPQESQLGECLQNSSPSFLFTDTDTTPSLQLQPVVGGIEPQTRAIFPGSSTGSNPSNPSLDSGCGLLSQVASLPPSLTNSPCSKKPTFSETMNFLKSQAGVASAQANSMSEQSYSKNHKHVQKEGSKAKNLEVERKRRSRIKDGEFQLRALVPNISKMDRASIIGDAIEYIIELKKTVKELEEELKNDDLGENVDQGNFKFSSKQKTRFEFKNSEVQVDVSEICEKNFLLRVEAEQQPSGFLRLMEVVSSIGLQVEDINITSCHGLVISSFRVEVDRDVEPHQLREALIKGLHAHEGDRSLCREIDLVQTLQQ